MTDRQHRYRTRTEDAIKGALIRLLADKPLTQLTIAEVAREAQVSRSTFYQHYNNLDDVYRSLVVEFSDTLTPLNVQVNCSDCAEASEGRPFCLLLREPGPYKSVVDDDRFMETFLDIASSLVGRDLYGRLVSAGYSWEQVQALCRFQLSGCAAAARGSRVDAEEWERVRSLIDIFIRGGVSACEQAKVRENRSLKMGAR